MAKRPNKFGAIKTTLDGFTFDSRAEATRYATLRQMERAGLIRNLELQPIYPVTINGVLVCKYKADFRYIDPAKIGPHGQVGCTVVEDVKGVRTPVYRLKKKAVEALYPGVVITEVGGRK